MSVLISALVMFRAAEATKAHEQFAKYNALHKQENRSIEDTHKMWIAMHKAISAVKQSNEAHEMINKEVNSTRENDLVPYAFNMKWKGFDFMEMTIEDMGDKAEIAYEYFESKMEDAALSKFHYDAFGER